MQVELADKLSSGVMPAHLTRYFLCNRYGDVRLDTSAKRGTAPKSMSVPCSKMHESSIPPSLSPLHVESRSLSGAEAIDNAIKIARSYTGRQNIITFDVSPDRPGPSSNVQPPNSKLFCP